MRLTSIHMHGLAEISSSQNMLTKLFWTIVFAGMLVCFTINAYVSIVNYSKNPVVTSIEVLSETELPVPKVLLCPFDFVDSKDLFDMALSTFDSPFVSRPAFVNESWVNMSFRSYRDALLNGSYPIEKVGFDFTYLTP